MAFQYWQQRGGRATARRTRVRLPRATAYHGDTIGSVSVGGIDLFHSRLRAAAVRHPPGRPGRQRATSSGCSSCTRSEIAAVIVEPLVQGAAGIRVQPPGYLRAVRELCDRARRPADLRRGRDRLRPHRDDVRLRAGARGARLPLPRQGADRRLPAARGDARDRARLRGLPRRRTRTTAPSSTATPTPATRSPARRRSPASRSFERSRRCCGCSRRSACSQSCSPTSRRCPRWPRSAGAASWSGSTSASTTRRCGSATG